ncbi:MAG: hypothetical protein IPH78_04365 [Bacteroidetes bacterium]|nr:hypothetical protein [Bacteroidota bacterium]
MATYYELPNEPQTKLPKTTAAEERSKMLQALHDALVLYYNGHERQAVEAALKRGGRPVNYQELETLWNSGALC